jgi:hypothetical protein
VASSNVFAFRCLVGHRLIVDNYEFDGCPLLAHLVFESTWATLEMATTLFAAELIAVRCWSYHGIGVRYTIVSRDFARFLSRNGIVSYSCREAKDIGAFKQPQFGFSPQTSTRNGLQVSPHHAFQIASAKVTLKQCMDSETGYGEDQANL